MTKWIQYIYLYEIIKRIFDVYTVNIDKHRKVMKQWTIVSKANFLYTVKRKIKYRGDFN